MERLSGRSSRRSRAHRAGHWPPSRAPNAGRNTRAIKPLPGVHTTHTLYVGCAERQRSSSTQVAYKYSPISARLTPRRPARRRVMARVGRAIRGDVPCVRCALVALLAFPRPPHCRLPTRLQGRGQGTHTRVHPREHCRHVGLLDYTISECLFIIHKHRRARVSTGPVGFTIASIVNEPESAEFG